MPRKSKERAALLLHDYRKVSRVLRRGLDLADVAAREGDADTAAELAISTLYDVRREIAMLGVAAGARGHLDEIAGAVAEALADSAAYARRPRG